MGIRDIEEKFMTTATTSTFASSWRENFRHDTFRTGQDTAIESMAKKLDEGEKFIIAELPTGIGKSDVAMALAKSTESAFITTSQNILIDQYAKDFGNGKNFALVKGRKNYKCIGSFDNCHEGGLAKCAFSCKSNEEDEELTKQLLTKDRCTYKVFRDVARMSRVALTNTTYYALACKGELWGRRNLAVIDESHNLAGEVMSLTEMVISEKSLDKMRLNVKRMPFKEAGPVKVDHFAHYLEEVREVLEFNIAVLEKEAENGLPSGSDQLEDMQQLLQRIVWFFDSIESGVEWVVDFEIDPKSKYEKLIARPLDTAYFAQSLFFRDQANQFVLQSATIVDFKRYAEELGIDAAHTVRRNSPFDLSRRPIFDMGTADMSYKKIDESLPKIADEVRRILRERPDQKGLIHTGSYKVQKYLQDQFSNSSRCYFPGPGERQEAIEKHFSSKEPTVLFSPSMTEGIDGKGDALRFQVVCKLPYPSLADRRVKIKADRSYAWYQYQTLKTLIQAVGRGMRSEDDWCDNYVLDAGFSKFISKSQAPKDFIASIRSADEGLKAYKIQR